MNVPLAIRKPKKTVTGSPSRSQEDRCFERWPLEMKSWKSPKYSTEIKVSWGGSLDEKCFQVCKKVSAIKLLWDERSQQKIICHPEHPPTTFQRPGVSQFVRQSATAVNHTVPIRNNERD